MSLWNTYTSIALALALTTTGALAEETARDQHHPETTSSAATGTTAPAMPMMGQGMMSQGMMGPGMMGGMGMMGQGMMGTTGGGGMGMGMMSARAGHVEGRIAFLKAELKITDAQLPLWNAVADAMRANTKNVTDMPGGMMGMAQAATLPDKLAAREKMLTARLDAVRKVKATIDPLYAAFTDEQKKTADQIMIGMEAGSGMGMRMGMDTAGTKTSQ